MKNKNQSYLAHFGKVFFAAAYVAITSPMAYAASGFSTTTEQKLNNSPNQQLVASEEAEDLPLSVKSAVLQDISQRAEVEMSALRVVKAQKQSWSDGCLGLESEAICTQSTVPGWQVVVTSEQQMWVYRTDESGKVAKLDEGSSQAVTATMMRRNTTTATVQRRTQTMTVRRSTQVSAASVSSVKAKTKGFSLAILQPSGNFSEVITRISIKPKRGKGYLKERFLGDYKYKIKQSCKFVKGFKAGDRIVVRLYDTQNRFIGYSEFEALSANTTVNLILSSNPTEYKVVRTVYGVDADMNGMIDAGTTTYDYFTQVNNQSVSFLSSSRTIKVSQFQAQGLSIAANSVYPASFTKGEFAVVRQSMSAFSSSLAAALKAAPGSLVQVNDVSDNSNFDLAQMMMEYREVGVANGIQVKFSDVPTNYWAKDFIAELAAMEVLEGFPDGTFRPDEQVTKAQFAAMISQAFEKVKIRNAIKFNDVSSSNWAYNAIGEAYTTGFLTSSGNQFNPTANLSRLEILLSIARGLNYTFSGSTDTILAAYTDASSIRSDVRNAIAALTQQGIVVNYPNIESINAEKVATRAEVSALIYKALVSTGEVADISSQYAVGQKEQAQVEQRSGVEAQGKKPRQHCNQGIGNGAEGCDPGNSHPHGGSNDEGGRTPGGKK
ncbi:MAG: S-layer homology domain-containing protein [Hassallia sp.]